MPIIRLLRRHVSTSHIDAKAGQIFCWIFSAIVMILGIVKVCSFDLTEAQFFAGLLLVVAVSLLGLIAGILLPIAAKTDPLLRDNRNC